MTEPRRVWVDLNEVDRMGTLTTLLKYCPSDLQLGESVLAECEDAALPATVAAIQEDGLVRIQLTDPEGRP